MSKIIFNNVEFDVESYNKSTYFGGSMMNSNANCSLPNADISALNELAETIITSIQIKREDNTVIYDLQDIHARIDNTSEYLNGDRMNINVNLVFDNAE